MGSLSNISDIVNRLTGGNNGNPQHPFFYVDPRVQSGVPTAPVAGTITSLWRYNKSNGANGAVPTSAAVCDRTTLGALGQNNPGGGRQLWLLGWEGAANVGGTMMLYDRLLHCGNLSGTVTSAQTVGGSITRNTGGVGNEIWVEIYTQIGGTATTATVSYTNQAGATKTTPAFAIGGTGLREDTRIIKVPLADGDTGVQGVNSLTLAATTGTAGAFGVTIAKTIGMAPIEGVGCSFSRDYIAGFPVMPEVVTDACLAFALMTNSVTTPRIMGCQLHMIEA